MAGLVNRVGGAAFFTVLAQIVTALSMPVVTRLYSPSEYGSLNLVLAFIAVTAGVYGLRYEMAIPVATGAAEADALYRLAIRIAFLWTVLVAISVFLIPESTMGAAGFDTPVAIALVPLCAIAAYWLGLASNQAVRAKSYVRLGVSKVVAASSQGGVQLLAGLTSLGAAGLLLGFASSRVLATLVVRRRPSSRTPWSALVQAGKKWDQFPRYSMPASVVGALGIQASPILVALLYGAHETGLYALAVTVLALPAAVVGQVAGQVFLGEIAREGSESRRASLMTISRLLVIASWGFYMWVFVFAEEIFDLVFGSDFAEAGGLARAMAVAYAISCAVSPLSTLPIVLGRQRQAFFISVAETVARLVVLVGFGMLVDLDAMVLAFGAVGALIPTVYFMWLLRLVGTNLTAWTRSFSLQGLSLLALLAVLLGARVGVPHDLLAAGLGLAATALLTVVLLVREVRRVPAVA